MPIHSHDFVETYKGLVGFGLNRQIDENTIIYYLQKFSDDELMQVIKSRLQDQELAALFDMISNMLRNHLNEDEYHRLFLKEKRSHEGPG
jgi:TorA maturation chaperone TorD